MNVLVTGGAGFIGSHVAEALLRLGSKVAVLDNFDDFYPQTWKRRNLEEVGCAGNFTQFESDISDVSALDQVFARFEPELVVHLAAGQAFAPPSNNPRFTCGSMLPARSTCSKLRDNTD